MATMSTKHSSNLLDSSQAIGTYLDDLLQSATDSNQSVDQVVKNKESPVDQLLDDLLQTGTEIASPSRSENLPVVEDEIAEAVELEPQSNPVSRIIDHEDEKKQQDEIDKQIPVSMEFPCQCMMFSVGQLRLAIPLMDLKAVHVTDDQLTRLPGSDRLTAGILSYRDTQIRVIDSHQVFSQSVKPEKPAQQFYLVLESYEWALTCDSVSDIETVNQDDFQQRADTGKVITGNIRGSLTGLLNVPNLHAFVLDDSETRADIASETD